MTKCANYACRAAATLFAYSTRLIQGRTAILLVGGNKTGDDRFYKKMILVADRLYDEHLTELRKEGFIP